MIVRVYTNNAKLNPLGKIRARAYRYRPCNYKRVDLAYISAMCEKDTIFIIFAGASACFRARARTRGACYYVRIYIRVSRTELRDIYIYIYMSERT